MRFPTSRVQSFWMTGPFDESISCFLIKVDHWVLVPISFRGLYVLAIRGLHILACRGLHALAFRGLRVLIFSVLHIHTLREYKQHSAQRPQCQSPPADVSVGLCRHDIGIAPTRRPMDPKKSNRALGFPALVTGLYHSYRVPVPPARSCHRDIGITPTRHLVDLKKSNRALGFPALVTGLCQSYRVPVPPARPCHRDIGIEPTKTPSGPGEVQQGPGVFSSGIAPVRHPVDPKKSNRFYGVPVTPSKVIRPPTNRAFIKKYCIPRQAQGETPQQPGDGRQRATDAPPSPLEFTSAHSQKG
ncbi:hypothetical protein HKD37_11G032118 [Glycine soja]